MQNYVRPEESVRVHTGTDCVDLSAHVNVNDKVYLSHLWVSAPKIYW